MDIGPRSFDSLSTGIRIDAETISIHSCYSAATSSCSPIVFIPGLGLSGRSLLPTARSLSTEIPIFLIDLPGYGDSDPPPRPLDLAEHASVLAAWLAAIGFERAVWVGHSFGCQVAAELATGYPEAVERLVLVSPTVDPRARSINRQLARLLRDGLREPLPLLPLLVRDYLKAGPRALIHAARLALRDRIEERLLAITVPTLVVRGERDPLVPAEWAQKVARLLPFGRLFVISDAAHAVAYSAPRQLARAIEEFCQAGRNTLIGQR